MGMPTLLDIVKANGSDMVTGLIDEASRLHPEVTMGAARTIKGLNYKTLIRTGVPTVGFRAANSGVASATGTYENRLVETYIMNPRWECDKAVADRYEDGAEAYITMEANAIMEGAMQKLASQFYYGTTTDGSFGFPGLIAAYDSTNMVVDAGGTTASTGSSVWGVKFGPRNVQWVYGSGGNMAVSELALQRILDGSSNPYTAYVQEMLLYPGLQVASVYSIGRIKKLTADSGKGLTDSLIGDLLQKFADNGQMPPDVLFASPRSINQLRKSRTATNATGAPAPFPTEAFGIPLVPSNGLTNTESLTL